MSDDLDALPQVGQRMTFDYGPKNPNTWREPGEVRAIVDGHIIVRRSDPREGYGWALQLITPELWRYAAKNGVAKVIEDQAEAGRAVQPAGER